MRGINCALSVPARPEEDNQRRHNLCARWPLTSASPPSGLVSAKCGTWDPAWKRTLARGGGRRSPYPSASNGLARSHSVMLASKNVSSLKSAFER